MRVLADSIKAGPIKECVNATVDAINEEPTSTKRLTLAALLRFGAVDEDKPTPTLNTRIKDSVVKTGAYYFGPMFVMDKGTSVPNAEIIKELDRRGFYTDSLTGLNNAQLNLFFITLKSLGLVSDKHLIGYVKYSA